MGLTVEKQSDQDLYCKYNTVCIFVCTTPIKAFPNLWPFRIKIILKRILLKDETKNILNELGP